ncbi:MAG: undecaprenyldiphospho-muramoylpentapeptide beta-N-acetylglucosaminyltransferase [Pseudomonadota bacterium]
MADEGNKAPLIVLAAGGTGGHMFPAQALAETMLKRGWRVALASDERGLRYAGGFPATVTRIETASASPSRGGLMAKLRLPFTIWRGMSTARAAFAADRPMAVAGFGGYPALPSLLAAISMRIPSLIHEQNAVLGRVNKLLAGQVGQVCCGTWPVVNAPKGVALTHVGNPVRAAVAKARGRVFAPPAGGRLKLTIFGGSQGAGIFGRVVPEAVAALPKDLRDRLSVTQQVRAEDGDTVAAAYQKAGVTADLAPFFDDMPARLAKAHLVIARAGASTVAELTAIGRPAILVPYRHATDDHQTANARALAEAGGAHVLAETDFTAEALTPRLAALMGDGGQHDLAAMAAAARDLGRPDAAEALADIVTALASGRAVAK